MININKKVKIILLGIGFTLLLVFLYTNANLYYLKRNANEDFKKEFPKTLYIINETDYDITLKSKIILNKIFNYDSLYVKFDYMEEPLYIEGLEISAHIVKSPIFDNQYVVYFSKRLKPYHEEIILSHELIHLDQFERGDMEYVNVFMGEYRFLDDTINMNFTRYSDRPDEIEAYNLEDSVYNELQILIELYKK